MLHKSSERSSLLSGPGLNSSPPGAKNPGVVIQQQPFTGPGTLPGARHLLRSIPPQRPVGACPHLLWDGAPSLFGHQGRGFLPLYREVFLDLRSGPLISLLSQTSASATRFVLGVCEWEHSFNFTPLDKYQLSSPEALLSPMSNPAERHEPQKSLLGG